MTTKNKKPMELYVHIPFCASKCLYCDFLSFRAPEAVHEAYTAQLIREIEAQAALCQEYQAATIFIGGGTPSVMEPCLIADIMRALMYYFDVAGDAEITIEVNPGTLLHNKLHIYREAGINRLSIGLQSTDNRELKDLGRIHTFEEFLKSFQCARMVGFANINVDLMSSIPGQTFESFKNTLKKVAMLKPEHISAYSLIIEEGTPFWEHYGQGAAGGGGGQSGLLPGGSVPASVRPAANSLSGPAYPPLPDEDTENRIYHLTRTLLKDLGYGRYEISNYARPGYECRHNIGYWTAAPYLGLGLGASSYMGGCRFSNTGELEAYMELDFGGEPEPALWQLHGPVKELSREARMEEFLFLGLRLMRGVSEIDFVSMFGVRLENVFGPVIDRLISKGLLKKDGVWISLTEWGMDVSNHVLSEFLLS